MIEKQKVSRFHRTLFWDEHLKSESIQGIPIVNEIRTDLEWFYIASEEYPEYLYLYHNVEI